MASVQSQSKRKHVCLESLPEPVLHNIFLKLMEQDSMHTAFRLASSSRSLLAAFRRMPTIVVTCTDDEADPEITKPELTKLALTCALKNATNVRTLRVKLRYFAEALLSSWLLDVRETLSHLSLAGVKPPSAIIRWDLLRFTLPQLSMLEVEYLSIPKGPFHLGLPNLTILKLSDCTGQLKESLITSFPLLKVLHLSFWPRPDPLTIRHPSLTDLVLVAAFDIIIDAHNLTRLCCQGYSDITIRGCPHLQSVDMEGEVTLRWEDDSATGVAQRPALTFFSSSRVLTYNDTKNYMEGYLPLLADSSKLTELGMYGDWPAHTRFGPFPSLKHLSFSLGGDNLETVLLLGSLPSLTQVSITSNGRFKHSGLTIIEKLLRSAPALKTVDFFLFLSHEQESDFWKMSESLFLLLMSWIARVSKALPSVKLGFHSEPLYVPTCPLCSDEYLRCP